MTRQSAVSGSSSSRSSGAGSPARTVYTYTPGLRVFAKIALPLILVITAGLRFYALDASSLWSDEGNTWAIVQRSFAQIAHDAAADIHPPGYYWLLKLWTLPFGTSAYALRAFSALCGIGVVGASYWIARQLAAHATREPAAPPVTALPHDEPAAHPNILPSAWLVAWILALNPLQIYYSQEARMYMPLTLAGVGLYGALLVYTRREAAELPIRWSALAFMVCGALGVWLHYSFPILLLGAGLFYAIHWAQLYRAGQMRNNPTPRRALLRFGLLCGGILLSFAPWLPTAVARVLAWPQSDTPLSLFDGLERTLTFLLFGPLQTLPTLQWPWLLAAALLPLLGLWALRRNPAVHAVVLWLVGPILMMFALDLFSDAFLKFLLSASPAWALAVAYAPGVLPTNRKYALRPRLQATLALGALWLAVITLPGYYTNPTARDNYAGMARYVAAHAQTQPSLVILNAPGQQDVWNYYDPGVPVLALPTTRPPERAATEAALAQAVTEAGAGTTRIFALFWATNESDPEAIVESWLNQHAFPGLESWQGNVRFVDYTHPTGLNCTPSPADFVDRDGREHAMLAEHCFAGDSLTVASGQVLPVGLEWHIPRADPAPVAVSLQLLDARNQVVAQRDAPLPRPDPDHADAALMDNHGVPLPVGIPPGTYRLILALYSPQSGVRLTTGETDAFILGDVTVTRPGATTSAPAAALVDANHMLHRTLGPVTLLGYSLHHKEYAHAPQTPIHPGDPVQVTFYWQAPPQLPPDWPERLTFELRLGETVLHAPLAGDGYPTGAWQPNEIVRGQFELPFDGTDRRARLTINGDTFYLAPLPK